MESTNQRITEDLRTILIGLQNDFHMRLETRVSEVVNRLMMEHEERVRTNVMSSNLGRFQTTY